MRMHGLAGAAYLGPYLSQNERTPGPSHGSVWSVRLTLTAGPISSGAVPHYHVSGDRRPIAKG